MLRKGTVAGLILAVMAALWVAPSFAAEIPGWPKFDKEGPVGLTAAGKQVPPRFFGDVDGNGKTDCVVVKGAGVAVFERNDDGTWTETAQMVHPTGTAGVSSIAVADTDGDGRQEIFFGTAHGSENNCRVYVFEHKEKKTFAHVGGMGPYANSSVVRCIKAVDADLDGKPEIAVTHAYGRESYVKLYSARENDKWTEVWKAKITEEDDKGFRYPNTVTVADLDNDKMPEIYVAVQHYDPEAKKCHGWLYAYEMDGEPGRYRYERIWRSDDMEAYVSNVRVVREKQSGKIYAAAQVDLSMPPSSPACWALFGSSEKNAYSLAGIKTVKEFNGLYEECGR